MIAGSSNSESDFGEEGQDSETEQQRIEEMRAKLLGGLDNESGDEFKKGRDLQIREGGDGDESEEELDVKFGIGFGEDIGQKLIEKRDEKKNAAQMSDFQKWQLKKADKKRVKKHAAKEKAELMKKQGKMTDGEVAKMTADERKKKAEIELLIGDGLDTTKTDGDSSKKRGNDGRFSTSDKDFAVDPTHKEFRKVA